MFVGISKYLFIVCRKRCLEDSCFWRDLLLGSLYFLFLRALFIFKIFIEFIVFVLYVWFSLKLIKIIHFQLGPNKISLFWILLYSPPKSSLEQTFDKQIIISFSKIIFVAMLRLECIWIFKDDGIEDSVCEIDHK